MTAERTSPTVPSEAAAPPDPGGPGAIEMPAPTAWPMVFALGIALLAGGLLTNLVISAVGALVVIAGVAGWVRQLLPGGGAEREELVPPPARAQPVHAIPGAVEPLRSGMAGHRLQVPEKVHPYSAGIKGGAVGGVAMAVIALVYGLVSGRGIWYPINLLAAILLPSFRNMHQLQRFSLAALVLGIVIHGIISVGGGLLYGMLLPTLPRWPIIMGGLVAPLLWTGAVYGFMGVLNPVMNREVDWPWFIASQFAYGLAVGLVVVRSEQVYASSIWGGAGGHRGTEQDRGNP